ncbi:MAG: hypothetical protein V4858_10120 [Pseudomonadota bacterium]
MKNKTLATWLAFVGGPLGFHRFYLFGFSNRLGWLLPIPTLLGFYGVHRARTLGLDDPWSWVLIPMLGFTIAGCAVNALVFGLMATDKWNLRFNPSAPADAAPGQTNWFTIAALVSSLLMGTTVLMASLAFSFQHYFEYQVEEGRLISQPPPEPQPKKFVD